MNDFFAKKFYPFLKVLRSKKCKKKYKTYDSYRGGETMRNLFAKIKKAGKFIVESFAYYDKVTFEANLGNRLYCIPPMGIPGGIAY